MNEIWKNIQAALGNPKRDEVLSFSGIFIVLAIVLVLNLLLGFLPIRFDLTQHSIYTLSPGTKKLVKSLDAPVKIRYFVTDDRDMMSPDERNISRTIEDRLLEYKKLGRGNIIFEKLNPEPDTNAEDAAEMAGLQPLRGQEGQIYMGVVVECLDQKEVIPYIDPNREELLEYDVTTAINRVYRDEKPKVKVMTPMNVGGGFAGGNFQAGPAPAWFFYRQLEADYDVETVPTSTKEIDADADVLVVLHPYDITETGEFAIDQYLLGGGSVVAVVDPLFYSARALTPRQPQNPFGGGMPPAAGGPLPSSDLPTLFEAWGVEYQSSQVLADAAFRTEIQGGSLPTLLSLGQEAMNKEDAITAEMVDIYMPFPGGLKISQKAGLTPVGLIESSEKTQLVNSFEAEPQALEQLERNFRPTKEKYHLVAKLSGKFKSAFPDGDPNAEIEMETGGGDENKAEPEDAPAEETKTEAPAPAESENSDEAEGAAETEKPGEADKPTEPGAENVDEAQNDDEGENGDEGEKGEDGEKADDAAQNGKALKESTKEGVVYLIADVDMFFDQFAVQQLPIPGYAQPRNQNLGMLQNLIETLANQELNLASLRSRHSTRRPFTRLNDMQAAAESQMIDRIQELEKQRDEVSKKLQEAMKFVDAGDGSAQIVIDQSNIDEGMIEKLRAEEYKASVEVRELRKQLKRRKDSFVNVVKLLNIAVMPLVVILLGLIVYGKRQSRMAAR